MGDILNFLNVYQLGELFSFKIFLKIFLGNFFWTFGPIFNKFKKKFFFNFSRKVCVHCKCDRSDHEIGGNQALNVYERLGIKPSSAEMAKVLQQQQQQRKNNNNENNSNDVNSSSSIGSAGHGYAWVPPGIGRLKIRIYIRPCSRFRFKNARSF
uniref:Candidate secreted effector n=1 Tax=Meloidogyne incognita TaxID=6306 RepID=A0A914NF38_MELIC